MPRTTAPEAPTYTAEEVAALVAQARSEAHNDVTGTVLASAQARRNDEPGMVGVALRQPLSPKATAEDRKANLLRALTTAGVLADDYRPSVLPEGVKITPGQVRCLTFMAQGHSYRSGAAAAYLNISTYKKHLGIAYGRLGVNALPEAIIAAVRWGVLDKATVLAAISAEAEAPTVARAPMVQCAAEGCSKRTRHESGFCPDHRAGE